MFGIGKKSSPIDQERDTQLALHLSQRRLEALKRREKAGHPVTVDRSLCELKVSVLQQILGGAK